MRRMQGQRDLRHCIFLTFLADSSFQYECGIVYYDRTESEFSSLNIPNNC